MRQIAEFRLRKGRICCKEEVIPLGLHPLHPARSQGKNMSARRFPMSDGEGWSNPARRIGLSFPPAPQPAQKIGYEPVEDNKHSSRFHIPVRGYSAPKTAQEGNSPQTWFCEAAAVQWDEISDP